MYRADRNLRYDLETFERKSLITRAARARAIYPSCVTVYPHGARSCVFLILNFSFLLFLDPSQQPERFAGRELYDGGARSAKTRVALGKPAT